MTELNWFADHWVRVATVIVPPVLFVAALTFFSETPQERKARKRAEARARTQARYNAIAEEYKRRERAKHEAAMTRVVDTTIASLDHDLMSAHISAVLSVPATDYDALARMREAEGSEDIP